MKKVLFIIIAVTALAMLYKWQHVRPVDDPEDSPLFQQRLKSSLDRFQTNEFPDRSDGARRRASVDKKMVSSSAAYRQTKDLVISGRCGKVSMTWVEDEKIEKESIKLKRRAQGGQYASLEGRRIYEREEEGGIRYWVSDSDLSNGVQYEYLIAMKDAAGKEVTRGPITINRTCTERDKEMIAQREKQVKEYYQQKGVEVKDLAAMQSRQQARTPARTKDLTVTGRCGKVTMTWVEDEKIEKESIRIKRKAQGREYASLEGKRIYEREEEGGIRYWVSDSDLSDGVEYEYLIAMKDAAGKEVTRGPVAINLTCTERDKEIIAQREKLLKEYYQKRGSTAQDSSLQSPPSYQLSKEIYEIEIGNSPQKGNINAPVTVVVFTDFECIHCATWAETLHSVQKTFSEQVKIVFKNYPLSYHKHADLAARAALAAKEQGKFWEMHDLLFKNRGALGENEILGYAKDLALDLEKFKKALVSERVKKLIEQDKAQGKTLGVQNVPTSFINGRSMVGAPPVSYLEGMISDVLKGFTGLGMQAIE